jgi:hypothetical protein
MRREPLFSGRDPYGSTDAELDAMLRKGFE